MLLGLKLSMDPHRSQDTLHFIEQAVQPQSPIIFTFYKERISKSLGGRINGSQIASLHTQVLFLSLGNGRPSAAHTTTPE